MFGIGFLIIEILVPLIIIMMVIRPLKTVIKAILGMAFSAVYHSLGFAVFIIERMLSTAEWAGQKYAWAIVTVIPIAICGPVAAHYFDLLVS